MMTNDAEITVLNGLPKHRRAALPLMADPERCTVNEWR